jgi:hypothetical protein
MKTPFLLELNETSADTAEPFVFPEDPSLSVRH